MEKIKLIEIAIPPVKAVDTVCFFLEFAPTGPFQRGFSTSFDRDPWSRQVEQPREAADQQLQADDAQGCDEHVSSLGIATPGPALLELNR